VKQDIHQEKDKLLFVTSVVKVYCLYPASTRKRAAEVSEYHVCLIHEDATLSPC